jgi:hypothetical protein
MRHHNTPRRDRIRKRPLPAGGIFACNGIREQDWIAAARHAGCLTPAQPGRRGAAAGARLSPESTTAP